MENNEGFHLEEGIKIAQKLDNLCIDAINVSAAGGENGQSHSLEPVRYNQGWRDHLTYSIKKMVSCPVFGNSVIRDPEYAEYLLENGKMDFVGMGRSFLADPYWVAKAKSGHTEDIRKCISCLRCIDNIKSEQPIICSINPECGNETHIPPIHKDGANRLVIIVGAGVGGLEAARILSQREFKVIVFEKTAHIGGQVYLASRVPGKEKMAWFIDFLETECEKQGVEFRLNTAISSNELLLLNPYAIIDATGSSPWKPTFISGLDNQMVLTPVDILSGSVFLEHKNVAIIGSGLTGLETAEVLVEHNNMVTIIEMANSIAPGGSKVNVNDILRKLAIYNTVLIPNRKLTGIENDRIHYDDAITGESYTLPVDNVILSLGVRPVGNVFKELDGKFTNLFAIGDAKTQGRIREAVVDGYNIGITLV